MRRRAFLKHLSLAPAGAAVGAAMAQGQSGVGLASVPAQRATLSPDQWLTLAAVQGHLLPSEPDNPNAPGAMEVHATAYLDRTLAVPGFDVDVRALILNGVGWLNDLATEHHQVPFTELSPETREDLLHQIAATRAGERWLSNLISYTLEALLADPLYGGNPDGIGWAWLGHDPGLPRPTPANMYGKLGR